MSNNIKILIVDDSAFARLAISREVSSLGGIEVVDFARNGYEALEKIKRLKPDVVTLDIEMPDLNGLQTLEKIMSECPTPVVMISSLTGTGTEATIGALEAGAVDFFLKHTLANPIGGGDEADTLKNKIITASKAKLTRHEAGLSSLTVRAKLPKTTGNRQLASSVVMIGSSTGGPKALYQVVPALPADLPAAVLIVQHMPPGFTGSLANRLDQLSGLVVKEAAIGDVLYNGAAYIARGGFHMVVEEGGFITLNQNPAVCGVRPSVDVTMQSLPGVFGSAVLGVVLTGMGSDGTNGSKHIKRNGGRIIAEDESTCVVWGMPKSVAEAGYADLVLPLPRIANAVAGMIIGHEQGVIDERSRLHLSKK
jgi:two-component system, chemotaxis family, protein-glutamate methylesterase/glutaminase